MLKLKVRIVGNYVIRKIKKLSKCSEPTQYIRCSELKYDSGFKYKQTISIRYKSNNDADTTIKSYKDVVVIHNVPFIDGLKRKLYILKYKPSKRLINYLKNINRRYDRTFNPKQKKFYAAVNDYINTKVYTITGNKDIDHFTINSTYIESAIHGCKIILKGYNGNYGF